MQNGDVFVRGKSVPILQSENKKHMKENKTQIYKRQMAVREIEIDRESYSLKEGGFENCEIKPYRSYANIA